MSNFMTKLLGDKKDWNAMEARADALPRDHGIVYDEIKSFMWRFTSSDGMDIVAVLKDVLAEFEAGAAEGKNALEVTGEDVAAFCDERLGGPNPYERYLEKMRASLNADVKKKL
jgi:DNA-binding ferritin-like protein (Dps family)